MEKREGVWWGEWRNVVSRGETIIFSFFKLLQYRVMGSGDGRVGTCFLMDQCNLKNVPSILTEESYIKHFKKSVKSITILCT